MPKCTVEAWCSTSSVADFTLTDRPTILFAEVSCTAPLTLVAYGMIPTTEALVPMHQAEMQNMVRLCSAAQSAGENGGKRKHSELINSPNKKVRHLTEQ